ncbi:unnamed protein product [Allacma fusca]|uniref:Uncharacterized protein n=1 Tax=Allacma fusca TaxID=39272 RepID=A0A8J2JYK4_9HEXA|nr:unnamed protein product [Allacma fusca]
MYLHHIPSSYGRLVPKPEKLQTHEELYDDNVSVQDQIENLRIKISLKERYNKVLKDEMEESRQGATTIIHDLCVETKHLRQKFVEAVQAEKMAVQNALRTHREFQLALRGQVAENAIPWLDDKLFDMAKRLNCLLFRLYHKRRKLEEVEQMVETMEKWPRPGSLPWELEAIENFHRIEYDIENMKVKLETASILHSKYYEIKFILREERGKYAPVLRALDNQLQNQRRELGQLQKMLEDAIVFQNDASKKLTITEQEASENRKRRKRQMARMKKAVQKILEANQLASSTGTGKNDKRLSMGETGDKNSGFTDETEVIRGKKQEVERFQDRTRRLVEVMKVPDLTYIPVRYQTVIDLGLRFEQEQKAKEDLRDMLLRQQNMLNLILCHFLYTGQREESEFTDRKRGLEKKQSKIEADIHEYKGKMQKYGELVVEVRLALLSLIERFEDTAKRKKRYANANLMTQLKIIHKKVSGLMESVAELERQLPPHEEESKNYQQYMKPQPIPPRLIRVGTPVKDEDSDAEEDFADLKVPGRLEIKAKSLRFLNQAKLKRGIR